MNIQNLEPRKTVEFFSQLCSVPHGSGNTDRIAELVVDFAKKRGLEYIRDGANNVIIFKKASEGYEDKPTVIIQGHMDMVCVKTEDSDKDLKNDGLDLMSDGTWLWADKTSLGGDDCIAVATAMAILDDDTLDHPALECVFTTDEEVGMDGAAALDTSVLKGRTMINLDNEEEGVFTVGCAGGARIDCLIKGRRYTPEKDFLPVGITVCGLIGGHSGEEINKGRANANNLLGRILGDFETEKKLQIAEIKGGSFDNVIASKAHALVYIHSSEIDRFRHHCNRLAEAFVSEYPLDPGIQVKTELYSLEDVRPRPLSFLTSSQIIGAIRIMPQGVVKMSRDRENFVQTSMNLGVITLDETGLCRYTVSVRSSVESEKQELIGRVKTIATLSGAEVSVHGDYPGWKYSPVSPLRDRLTQIFTEITGKTPKCEPIHAGLECGYFASKIPGLDVVALGPTIKDIHSVNEKLYLPSVEVLYKIVTRYLETC